MQQAIYNNSNSSSIQTSAAKTTGASTPKASGLRRWVARKWDFVGVLTLMGASAAYGVSALAHLGL